MITDLLTVALPAVGAAVLAYGEPHVERLVARRTLEALSVVTGQCKGQVEGQGWGGESGSGSGPGERLRQGTGAGVTVRATLRVRVGVHQWLIHKTLLRPRAMAFEQALHHASPVVSRHAMRPASPTIAQRPTPNAQCPMPARQAALPLMHLRQAGGWYGVYPSRTEWLRHGGGTYEHSGLPSSCSGSPLGVGDSEVSLRRSALDAGKLPESW